MAELTERVHISAAPWWVDQMQTIAETQGLSLAALVRVTCVQAWRLAPPEEKSKDGEDDSE